MFSHRTDRMIWAGAAGAWLCKGHSGHFPGPAGYYDFQQKNNADYDIRFVLKVSEGSFHLPILYSVRDLQTNYLYQGGSMVNSDGSAISTDYILLPAHSQKEYRLGWELQFEDRLLPQKDAVNAVPSF